MAKGQGLTENLSYSPRMFSKLTLKVNFEKCNEYFMGLELEPKYF